MRISVITPNKTLRFLSSLLRWAGNLMLLAGILCTGWYSLDFAEAHVYQAYQKERLAEILKNRRNPVLGHPMPKHQEGFIGRLDIARIGISTVILEGTDAHTLKLGVGHVRGTALPGVPGNISLAAHRDTFFRALRRIRKNDEIRLITPEESFKYRVDWMSVVKPSDTRVLRPDKRGRTLTLLTCYPFNMIGSAPDRFVVRAHLVSTTGLPRGAVHTLLDQVIENRPICSMRSRTRRRNRAE